MGHVNRELCGLRLAADLNVLPVKGDKLFQGDKEVGHISSTIHSPRVNANLALGYVRREVGAMGTDLKLRTMAGQSKATIVDLPFVKPGTPFSL
jgi:glycine cleavage system aminomethyltransferase T